ncbi:hypothetical protein RchiOBHm_Chr6g0305071 [Rosa chinensis]|uniref:Uncharacterized protein n=1 Tax=Rosa chinensis TaxID=74649 RepID=A0A2P6PZP4_ROSCH|nr:hypothetical protein RchiOBHm_Chr6g0305071 [Rosa chinensis]
MLNLSSNATNTKPLEEASRLQQHTSCFSNGKCSFLAEESCPNHGDSKSRELS